MSTKAKPCGKALQIPAPEAADLSALATPPVAICQGYSSVTGEGLSTAVAGATSNGGGDSKVDYTVCMDMKSLAEALEIDQSLSVGFGPFGSVDEKLKFVRKLDVTTYGISIVVFARHVMGSETLTDVKLKDGVTAPKDDAETRAFVRSYGDSYITSVKRGGEYYAVYTFYTQTREEQTSLSVEMKAKGIFDGVKVDASLQVKLDRFISETSTRTAFSQAISGFRNPALPKAENLISFAVDFPKQELTAPVVVSFQATGYEHVPKFGGFDKVVKNRNYFVGRGVADGITAKLVKVQQVLGQIGLIESIYKYYGGFEDKKLKETKGTAQTDLTAINDQMVAFESDPIQSFTEPPLPSLKDGVPSLQYKIGQSPHYGGPGGGPFQDVNPLLAIKEQTRIVTIQMRSGERIDQIAVTYENMHGKWTAIHGGGGGALGPVLTLLPGDLVTRISGRQGSRLDHLTVTITGGRAVDGGGGGGGPFSWDVPDKAFAYGFSGRSGEEDDAIAVDYAWFEAAKWD